MLLQRLSANRPQAPLPCGAAAARPASTKALGSPSKKVSGSGVVQFPRALVQCPMQQSVSATAPGAPGNASTYKFSPTSVNQTDLAVAAPNSGLILSIGDLKDLVPDEADLQLQERDWQTYLAFLSKFPLVDKDWELQLLPVTVRRDAGPAAAGAMPHATTATALPKPATTSRLEIDVGAMEQILAAAWASDSEEKRPVLTWVEEVFARKP
ncbi:uncharacterized protein C2845_PM03G16250 [Panicum miliaceum]|uniref:SMAX1-like AAA+ ATPase lid domain-containing protein n=1 Tax=Panicum miliaceum TaxID=4540 RepID=A0A3L6T880_PANMI|nr:uncharacterized protein C2845_PM03G16250 [Panicum miliaceum]